MNEYRISKYNDEFRINGIYTKDEWTSIGDIGKKYGDSVFTYEEYLRVEAAYLNVIRAVCKAVSIKYLTVQGIEDYKNICQFSVKQKVELNDIIQISQDCLREKYWCRLQSKELFVHFGYDYYIYIGTALPFDIMFKIVKEQGLYIEKCNSPYQH